MKSFLPSAIKTWNSLNDSIKTIADIDEFKSVIKKLYTPELLYKPHLQGNSSEYIHLSRIRMGLSGLNAHRKKYHFIDFSSCPNCPAKREDQTHYLLQCPAYAASRAELFANLSVLLPKVQQLSQSTLGRDLRELTTILISGTGNQETDPEIFKLTTEYIKNTGRFL